MKDYEGYFKYLKREVNLGIFIEDIGYTHFFANISKAKL